MLIISFCLFFWFCSIAIEAVVRVIPWACPSQTIFYSLSSGVYFLIAWASPPKISGLLELRFCKFLLTSTASPSVWNVACWDEFFLAPKQLFKCLVISEARIFWWHTWHYCSSSFFFGYVRIFSSMFLLLNRGLLNLNSLNPPLEW